MFFIGREIDIKMLGVSQCYSWFGYNDIIVIKNSKYWLNLNKFI